MRILRTTHQTYPLRGVFRISRGSKTLADVVQVEICEGDLVGRGECVPYPRYGQTVEGVLKQLESAKQLVDVSIDELQRAMAPGPARNALECAMWDLQAQQGGAGCHTLLAGRPMKPLLSAFTLSLGTPESMAEEARRVADFPLLKLKLGGAGDIERVEAVRSVAPHARLIADANESWSLTLLQNFGPRLADLGVELLEQPLPADEDAPLVDYDGPLCISADESCHDRRNLTDLRPKYDAITVKLDKTGGPTEAVSLLEHASGMGFRTMVGCMVATSLSMAPAFVVAQLADLVHLDGPLLLAKDIAPGMAYTGASLSGPMPGLWHI